MTSQESFHRCISVAVESKVITSVPPALREVYEDTESDHQNTMTEQSRALKPGWCLIQCLIERLNDCLVRSKHDGVPNLFCISLPSITLKWLITSVSTPLMDYMFPVLSTELVLNETLPH